MGEQFRGDSLTHKENHMTICKECKHCEQRGHNNSWYNFYCRARANRRQRVKDPITGQIGWESHNDFGTRIIVDDPLPHCREHNSGDCPFFEPANSK